MTSISAVTYLAASLCGARGPVQPRTFLAGHAFVLCCQFATHAVGDAADIKTDTLNKTATSITGGSRALLRSEKIPPCIKPVHARLLGHVLFGLALAILFLVLPSTVHTVGVAIVVMAYIYGAPPVLLNYRGLGELDASIVTNILLPVFAAGIQTAPNPPLSWLHPRLAPLVLPSFFVKIGAFLILNMADRRPDWASGKITLAVILGDAASAILVAGLMTTAYIIAAIFLFTGFAELPYATVALLSTAPYGLRRVALPLLRDCPYHKDSLLAPALFHSMFLVWAFALPVFCSNIIYYGASVISVESVFAVCFAFITVANVLKGRRKAAALESAKRLADVKLRQTIASAYAASGSPIADRVPPSDMTFKPTVTAANRRICLEPSANENPCVVVVGAGVAGLAAAATLRRLGISVVILEKRHAPSAKNGQDSGADLALWPSAISILRELGVPDDLFERHCYPLDTVYMCNMDFTSSNSTVLKSIDMQNVTEGTGERFVLVPRKHLMAALRALVPDNVIFYGCQVDRVEENDETECANVWYTDLNSGNSVKSLNSRIVIGTDGSRSVMRKHVVAQVGGDASVRFCNEVCYRGVLEFDKLRGGIERNSVLRRLIPGDGKDRSMRINYGAGLRSSFGYMSADRTVAYWWVKEMTHKLKGDRGRPSYTEWPEPLQTLLDLTEDDCFYQHPIEDSSVLPKWSSTRVVLAGDSAHTVTPNLGQGACQAVEDAFVLCTQLSKYWDERDGHLEAFYVYERVRKPYATAVRSEARTQLKLGQLRHPFAVKARETLLKAMPAKVLENKLRKHNFLLKPYLDTFRACEEALVRSDV